MIKNIKLDLSRKAILSQFISKVSLKKPIKKHEIEFEKSENFEFLLFFYLNLVLFFESEFAKKQLYSIQCERNSHFFFVFLFSTINIVNSSLMNKSNK
jgi:hypothetical protein